MKTLAIITATAVALVLAAPAPAEPVDLTHQDGPQDPLWVPADGEELGRSGFPDDEKITASWYETSLTACPEWPHDDPAIINAVLQMLNQTTRDFTGVWYVSDPETSITNYDGWINGEEAFKIDRVGVNRPLISENMNPDGVFQAGEIWEFIIQDYQNATGGPVWLSSVGVGSGSAGDTLSTGSIVVPEPASVSILALGAAGVLARRRRRN